MELYHEIKENAYMVIVAGSLDGNNAGEMNITLQKAIKSEKNRIIIDCRQLHYISSAGMGIFLSNLPLVKAQHKELIFFGMNPSVRKVFEVLGLENVLTISDTLSEAE